MLISVEGTGKDQLPVIMSSRNLLSFSDRRMMSPEMLIRVSFCSGVSLPGTKWWQKRRMFNTSWRILWQLPTEISNLLCNLVHRFPTVTSHNLVHAGHLLHLLTLMGDHYADHRQNSRAHHGSVYASHAPETFSLRCRHTIAAKWLMSPMEISAAKGKIWYSLTLNLPTTTIVAQPFNVIKWQLKFNPVA